MINCTVLIPLSSRKRYQKTWFLCNIEKCYSRLKIIETHCRKFLETRELRKSRSITDLCDRMLGCHKHVYFTGQKQSSSRRNSCHSHAGDKWRYSQDEKYNLFFLLWIFPLQFLQNNLNITITKIGIVSHEHFSTKQD